jgi:hypothetical protein
MLLFRIIRHKIGDVNLRSRHLPLGIVMSLVKLVEQQGDGEYVVLKDPSNATLKVYKTPESVLAAASSGTPAVDEIQMKSSAGWA